MRNRAIVGVVVAALMGMVVVSRAFRAPVESRQHQAHVDRAVQEWRQQPAGASVQVLIRTVAGAREAVREQLARLAGTSVSQSSSPDLLVAKLDRDALEEAINNANVLGISSDAPVKGTALVSKLLKTTTQAVSNPIDLAARVTATNESHLLRTLGLSSTLLGSAQLLPEQGAGIGVAVIDSGLDQNYASLDNVAYYDATGEWVDFQAKRDDAFGHGTHVAGLLASNGMSSSGQYKGIAPSVKIHAFKVLDAQGQGATSNVINAINYAVFFRKSLNLKVMNLSLGHPIFEPAATDPLVAAVENAVANGIIVVVSAGNFGGDPLTRETGYAGITSPGNAPSAITVGAVNTQQTDVRGDDSVAWFSSRGPTWYDGFQKPDVVAPGTHLVSNISTQSSIYTDYPNGIVKSGAMPFFKMSGTSMAAPVVAGVVANMLQAAANNGVTLTPNAVKAMLQYTAIPLANHDALTQGAGQVNAVGAIELAGKIRPNTKPGDWWLELGVEPYSTIAGQRLAWGRQILWGDRALDGDQVYTHDPAWMQGVVWGDQSAWGNRVIWGSSTVYDGNEEVWGNRIIWGSSVLGTTDGTRVIWGSRIIWGNRVIWGNLENSTVLGSRVIWGNRIIWGNLERANGDLR